MKRSGYILFLRILKTKSAAGAEPLTADMLL